MPVPDIFQIAPDFTVCEYCNNHYEDTEENMHRICVTKDGIRRIFVACIHCIKKAKEDPAYDEYMTNKTFEEKLGRQLKRKDEI